MAHRFSEDDARRIFARAAERQRVDAPEDGLSLAELQEIGLAAGLDPTHVAAAVAEIQAGATAAPGPTFFGVPSEWRRVRVLPVAVTDAAWERMVADLRRTFKQSGTPSQIGRVREWTAAAGPYSGGSDGLRIALEPTDGGTRVTAEILQRDNVRGLRTIAWFTPIIGALSALMPLLSGRSELWMLPILLTVVLAGVVASGAWTVRHASRRMERDAEGILDRFDVIARDAATPVADAAAPVAGRLDAGRLDDLPDADAPPQRRDRDRS